jgi:NAD(P)-dependent dehydrogenase (short-subunit alcohol dehydrogenase family)
MSGLLQGKVVLITGAASGIGFATALMAAKEGSSVALCDRDSKTGEEALGRLLQQSPHAIFVPMDVTVEAEVAAAVKACVDRFGRLDCAFNNAGISADEPGVPMRKTADLSVELWRRVLSVNLEGVWRCMRHELRQMSGAAGSIVNNASVAGLVGLRGQAAYAASKHGVIGLTRTAAAEYACDGIRVNAVCPGFVRTPLTAAVLDAGRAKALDAVPQRRLGTPEEIAEAVVWLLSDRSSYVTGAAITADGGYTSI